MKVCYDQVADLGIVADKSVAIIESGSQENAQARTHWTAALKWWSVYGPSILLRKLAVAYVV